ncbi:MAG: hypothetical protein V7704_12925 [Aurantimonas endophytica]|uniref:Uncharacterized protein n=1 Tax=Aurantimonas endophytica TaxID=1522175 RepID=A0A7W6HD91_9HYPH|nr:hypothetical protein [Aurantimonas endophytica]MBB4002922.1 hypothetical protein [Aurantimonas endophytica]MCO6403799.1 hypothetical protein [Aurantimonas endophytica]
MVQNLKPRARMLGVTNTIAEVSEILSVDIVKGELVVSDSDGERRTITVRDSFFMRSIPQPGNFLVRYADGHISHCSRRRAVIANANITVPSTPVPTAATA